MAHYPKLMKLIPVIDLMNGDVVTAIRGQRHNYLPSSTPLCPSCEPRAVLSALLQIHEFETVYIADLDAIGGNGSNIDVINTLHQDHPEITFWVDNGVTDILRLTQIARPVIGSESIDTVEHLCHLLTSLPTPILSLDYLDDFFKGPDGLEHQTKLWPKDVIVMTLSRVGSAAGVDISKLKKLKKRAPDIQLYAAGGVRDHNDLVVLCSLGITGALLSTALHQGSIDSIDIKSVLDI
jgi:phosphoribosylformimino-5-aminoimidazole carboxamide ribotide isomerase